MATSLGTIGISSSSSDGAGGVGVRIQSPESKFKYDIILGYQALMLNPRPQGGQYQYNGQDVNFKKVNQSVFIGLGLSF